MSLQSQEGWCVWKSVQAEEIACAKALGQEELR